MLYESTARVSRSPADNPLSGSFHEGALQPRHCSGFCKPFAGMLAHAVCTSMLRASRARREQRIFKEEYHGCQSR